MPWLNAFNALTIPIVKLRSIFTFYYQVATPPIDNEISIKFLIGSLSFYVHLPMNEIVNWNKLQSLVNFLHVQWVCMIHNIIHWSWQFKFYFEISRYKSWNRSSYNDSVILTTNWYNSFTLIRIPLIILNHDCQLFEDKLKGCFTYRWSW